MVKNMLKKVLWNKKKWKTYFFASAILSAGLFTACGQESGMDGNAINLSEIGTPVSGENDTDGGVGSVLIPEGSGAGITPDASAGQPEISSESQTGTSAESSLNIPADAAKEEEIKKLFGDNCIVEQTFEVELSEYNGKVWFVPYAPSENGQDFRMQIVQNGEVLKEINAYVPEDLAGKKFSSLDAVTFYDMNYDDITDIMLIETYGDKTFTAVYYGYDDEYGSGPFFLLESQLSETLSDSVEPLTVSAIRGFLSGGKKNGEFTDYREAYQAVSRQYEMEGTNEKKYDLIYVDDDDIPELVAAVNGYYVSLYTYDNGKVYTLMDDWGYGAMGNAGYEYIPECNRLRNYNTDFAGAILYTTYMTIGRQKSIEVSVEIETYNFDDANKNGMPDKNEEESLGKYSVSYVNGEEISEEEYCSYDEGEYEYIEGKMSLEELQAELKSR